MPALSYKFKGGEKCNNTFYFVVQVGIFKKPETGNLGEESTHE